MSRVLNGDDMINSTRRRTMCPDDTRTFTDNDILDIIDEELNAQVLEKLKVLHGDNLTVVQDVKRNAEGVYEIPYRALGNTLRDVSLVSGNTVYELSQVSVSEVPDYSRGYGDSTSSLDTFYMENSTVVLNSPERSYDTLRFRYLLRPNFLTKLNQAGIISEINIDEQNDQISLSLSSVGRNFSGNSLYDIIGEKSPNKIKMFDIKPESVTIGTNGIIVFKLSDFNNKEGDIKVGDYVSIAGETPVPNIPTEMHPLLAQAAAVQILESLNDTEALRSATMRLDKMTASIQTLVDNRVDLAPKKIKPRHSTLKSAVIGYRGKRGRRWAVGLIL